MSETLITSSVIIIILCAVRSLLKGKIRPVTQYALWGIAAARMVFPCFYPVINWFGSLQSPLSVMNAAVPLSSRLTAGTAAVQAPVGGSPAPDSGVYRAQLNIAAVPEAGIHWSMIFYGVWAAGSILLLLWLLFAHIRMGKRLLKAASVYEGPVPYGSKIPVFWAGDIPSPCYFVYFGKKAIYLPESLRDKPGMIRHVLVHESCHAMHRDHIWGLLRCVLLCCYWINPLVWAAAYLSKRDCEIACDEAAVQVLGETERFSYGRTLISLASARQPWNVLSTASDIGHGKKSMKERITILARNPKTAPVTAVFVACAVILLILCTFTEKTEHLPDAIQSVGEALRETSKESSAESSKETSKESAAGITTETSKENFAEFENGLTAEDIAALADLPKDETLWESVRQMTQAVSPLPSVSAEDGYIQNTVACYAFLYEGEEYELQVSGMKEDGSMDYIALQRMATGEWLNIYRTPEDVERYGMTLADGAAVRTFLKTHKSMSGYVTYRLPEGLSDGAYMADMGNGGNLFLTENETHKRRLEELSEHVDEASVPLEWRSAGGIVRWDYGLYKEIVNGSLIETGLPWNHSAFWGEKISIADCEVPALLEPVSHDLYTAASFDEAEIKYGPIPEENRTSRMWYVFFARQDSEVVYAVYLNADLFEKEDVLKLARSVHFKENAFMP